MNEDIRDDGLAVGTQGVGEYVTPDKGEIDLEVWRRVTEKQADGTWKETGFIKKVGRKTFRYAVTSINKVLGKMKHEGAFSMHLYQGKGDTQVPEFSQVIVYAVKGGSEGHYVHVDLLMKGSLSDSQDHDNRLALAQIKTFQGADYAVKMATRLSKAFGTL